MTHPLASGTGQSTDVLVVGGGVIGLACATACATAGLTVRVISNDEPGLASVAAAGMLAPTLEHATEAGSAAARRFALASRDRYPSWLEEIAARTGLRVALDRNGILRAALSESQAEGLRTAMPPGVEWLSSQELVAIEPALAHAHGATLHPNDGAVDNVALLAALRELASSSAVRQETATITEVQFDSESASAIAGSSAGTKQAYSAASIVMAAGAWTTSIAGLPRHIPVKPLRGQMVAYSTRPTRRVVYGPSGYVVPRGSRMLAGATMDDAGFDASTTAEGLAAVQRDAESLVPALAGATIDRSWAGLRPVTPDLLPVIGADPEQPRLIWACGHSRNGILLAPLTADCVAALIRGDGPSWDLSPFHATRFSRA